jgi:ribA/ribD-fused uncharacterized protein
MSEQKQAKFYMGRFYALDNFAAFQIQIPFFHCLDVRNDFEPFQTSEHAYQFAKFTKLKPEGVDRIRTRVRESTSAHAAKQIAGAHRDFERDDWKEVKLRVMEEILRAKFEQHEYVQRVLSQTRGMKIIEDSPVDDFWGRGPNHDGQNHLGRLWMKIRLEEFGE